MRHELVGGRAVPVPLPARRSNNVTGPDHVDRSPAGLDASFAFGDVERLPDRMHVPAGARTGREVDRSDRYRARALALRDRVDVHVAGEPAGRASYRRARAKYVHGRLLSFAFFRGYAVAR